MHKVSTALAAARYVYRGIMAHMQRRGGQAEAAADRLDDFLASVEGRALRMAQLAAANREDGLDIVQEAMFAFVRSYAAKPEQEWRPLFFQVVQSKIRDHHRRQAVRRGVRNLLDWWRADPDVQDGDPLDQLADPAPTDPQRLAIAHVSAQAAQQALRVLPLRQQQVFLLRAWEGLDVAQTAQAMGISEGSVKTHYFRALTTLRRLLADYAP